MRGEYEHTTVPNTSALNNWSAVIRLQAGTFLIVHDMSGNSTPCQLVSADQNQLTVDAGIDRTFPGSDIRRILVSHDHFDRGGTRGLAFGALAGGLIGGFTAQS